MALGDVLDVQNGYAFSSKLFNSDIGVPLIRIRDLKNGLSTETRYTGKYEDRFVVRRNDLLIGMDGEFGCYRWRGGDALLNQRVCRLTNFSDEVDPSFVQYGINRHLKAIEDTTSYTTVKHLSSKAIKSIAFPLAPIEEQRRIVAILDEAFEGLARARANVEANVADADDAIGAFIESELRELGTPTITLQTMIDEGFMRSHLDGNHGSAYPRKDEFVEDGVPYISANCIVNGTIDFSRAKFLTEKRADTIRKGVAKDGDVIFAHNATVGPTALLRTEKPRVILGTSVTYYRPDTDRLDPEFLLVEMRGAAFRRQYEAVMRQSTRNQVPITMQRKFRHSVPSLAEQRTLARRCRMATEEVAQLSEAYGKKRECIDELSASLLSRAFTGELT